MLTRQLPTFGLKDKASRFWIMDAEGTVLLQSDHPDMVRENIRRAQPSCYQCHVSFEYAEKMRARQQGTTEYEVKGQPRKLAAFAPMEFANVSWVMVMNAPYDQVMRFARESLGRMLLLLGTLLASLSLIVLFLRASCRSRAKAQAEARHWEEKHKLGEQLRRVEERYHTVFEQSPDGILIIDPKTTLPIEFNGTAHRQLGYTREEFARLRLFDYQALESPVELGRRVERTLREGQDQVETQHRAKDGEIREVRVIVQTLELEGRPVLHCIHHDITERKRAEEALRIAHQELEQRVEDRTEELRRAIIELNEEIASRKKAQQELESTHHQLVEASRHAGMAELASGILHNVGNVINSVNVSSTLISDKVRNSKTADLARAVALMEAHADDLPGFFAHNPKGKLLFQFLSSLAEHLAAEQKDMLQELASLRENIEHVRDIVTMQQSCSKASGFRESLPVVELVEQAVRLHAGSMKRSQIQVIRDYAEVPPVPTEKHKVLQILVNVIRNAQHALEENQQADRRLILHVGANGNNRVKISVTDNGMGIAPENLSRLFQHGFTTRKDGHGFGLHSSTLAAKELGGILTAQSDGLGKGATFTLELPC